MAEDPIDKLMADVEEIAKASPPEEHSSAWVIPVVTAVLLISGFLVYYFVYVASQREHLANSNFRSLAVLGDQIQASVSAHGSVMEFYSDLARDKDQFNQFLFIRQEDRDKKDRDQETRRDYLKFLAPGLVMEPQSGKLQTSRFDVQRQNGSWKLVLTSNHHTPTGRATHTAGGDYTGSLELEKLMQPLVGTLPFDDIILVSEKGDIIYQEKKAGPQFVTLSALLEAQSEAPAAKAENSKPTAEKSGAPDSIAHNRDARWRSRSRNLTEVTLAGTRYKLFLQPVLVDPFIDSADQAEPAREWVLCGLRSVAAVEWEALSISYTAMIWFTVIFLAIAMTGPLLKVRFMNRREHFRVQELAALGLFLVLLGAVLTFSAIEVTGFSSGDNTEAELERLQGNLSVALHGELTDMRQQLVQWCQSQAFWHDAEIVQETDRAVVRYSTPQGAETVAAGPPPASIYPYTGNAFWTTDDGDQIIKWSTGSYVTPMIDISGETIFTHPRDTYLDGTGPQFYFTSALPKNKLDYLAVLSVATGNCFPSSSPERTSADAGRRSKASVVRASSSKQATDKPRELREDLKKGAAFLTAQPLSLIDPILGEGYGFAVVDAKGAVLFHSDKTRNLHENFLEESGWSRNLSAAAFGHSAQRALAIKYKGQNYLARVTGIAGLTPAPLSLIVYRDRTSVRTLNLQAITMASTLLLLFLAGPIIVVAIWWGLHRQRHAPEWLWPNAGRLRTYALQIALYTLLAILFLFAGFSGTLQQIIVSCAALPWAILLFTVLSDGAMKHSWQRTALAVSVACVVGALALFRVNWSHLTLSGVFLGGASIAAVTTFPLQRRFFIARWIARQSAAPQHAPAAHGLRTTRTFRGLYILNLLLAIFLAGVMLPIALFRANIAAERRLQLKQAQLHLASALDQRMLRIKHACNESELSAIACAEFGAPGSPVWNRIVFDPLFADGHLVFDPHSSAKAGEETWSPWFQSLVYLMHHDYNDAAAEALGVIPDRANSVERKASGSDWSWEDRDSQLTLRWHGIHMPREKESSIEKDLLVRSDLVGSSALDLPAGAALAILVTLIMGAITRSLVRRVFLFHVATLKAPSAQQAAEAIRDGRNVVILTPGTDWRADEPKWQLDVAELAHDPLWGETLDLDALPANCLVEIVHFEYTTGDQATDGQKLILVERLLRRPTTQVVVVMKVPVSMEDYRQLFPGFNNEVYDLRDEPPGYWRAEDRGPAQDLIWQECRNLPALWPLGALLAKDLARDKDLVAEEMHSGGTIAAELLERAEPYYRMIWKECSADQKFVLSQLASDGMPNPANERALRQLVRRGLILTIPQFRIVNESFRLFLCSAPTPAQKIEWRRESRYSGWGKVQVAFFIGLAAAGMFLLTTQNALWDSAAAYVTTGMGVLGTLSKVFNASRSTGNGAGKTGMSA